MASLKYYKYNSILFMINVVYLLSLFSFGFTSQIISPTHHTLDLSQHGQLSSCINSSITTTTTTGKNSATAVLEVFHKQSLCAYAADGATSSSSAEEILRRDQQRVNQIRQKIMNTNTNNIHDTDDHSAPVQSGYNLNNIGAFVVRIGLGTPAKKLHLVLDTGSDLTWTQCLPCILHCYKQRDRTFDPRNSTTYSNTSCTGQDNNGTCFYSYIYGGDSYTEGILAKDKLTVTQNDVCPNFTFGCSHNTTGSFGEVAGILGLSRGQLSFVSQTAQIYGRYFSYFLPSDVRSTGHLSFGRNINNTKDVKFTPLIDVPQNPDFYFIKIMSITVGKTRLHLPPSVFKSEKTIIDSGTTITYLPQRAYIAMRDEFKCQMNTKRYPIIAPAVEIFDTCFRVPKSARIVFPTISFTFDGDVTVELDPSGIFYVVNSSVVCLGFAGGEEDDLAIFGNIQQRNMEVVYDVTGKKLGFRVPAARRS